MQDLISTGEAARTIGISRERVLAYIRDGRLRVAARDGYGRRLLRRVEVERFCQARRRLSDQEAGRPKTGFSGGDER